MKMIETKKVIKADYSGYNRDSYFYGSMVSAYSMLNGIVYCVDSKSIPNIIRINDYKNYKKLDSMPGDKELFILYDQERKTYLRGFNVSRNKSCVDFKAYLPDTGEIIYLHPFNDKLFEIPEEFQDIPAMAILCCIKNYPRKYESKLDFIEKAANERFKFSIRNIILNQSHVKTRDICLLVDAEVSGDNEEEEEDDNNDDDDDKMKFKLTKERLFKLNNPMKVKKYYQEPFMASSMPAKINLPPIESQILVYAETVARKNLIYGRCKKFRSCFKDDENLTNLMIKMNAINLSYVPFTCNPSLNEMVIASDTYNDNKRYYRGMVNEIVDDVCMILFVDYGYIRPLHYQQLYRFPLDFSKMPFHAFCIHASNIVINPGDDDEEKHIQMINENLKPFGYGVVEHTDGFNITVKLYNNEGINMHNILMNNWKKYHVKKYSIEN